MAIIFEDFIYSHVCQYLSIHDNKELSYVNKRVFNNPLNKKIRRYIIGNRSSNLIKNLMKKYTSKIQEIQFYHLDGQLPNSKSLNALLYYRYYEKIYINDWYNIEIPWKKEIIDKYKIKITTNPSRLDFYRLIKRMNIKDCAAIGW